MEVPILYEDDTLLVCQKPAGVLSENGGMPELLQAQCSAKQIFCVHRLDKAVSGLMVYAKDGKTAAKLSESISSVMEEQSQPQPSSCKTFRMPGVGVAFTAKYSR